MKYEQVDPVKCDKFFTILSRLKRHVCKRYGNKCEKEVFVRRTINKWFSGKYFAVIVNEKTGMFRSSTKKGEIPNPYDYSEITIPVKHYVCVNACMFVLGYGEDIAFRVTDTNVSNVINSMQFNQGSIKVLDFKEITEKEFDYVNNLFNDDRDPREFTMEGYNKTGKIKKKEFTIKAVDYKTARKMLTEQNPDYVIYG